jgi:hypothetical protein
MGKSFKPLIDSAINKLREEFQSALGKGKTYTERDFETFKLGRITLAVEFPPELEPDLDGDMVKVSYQNAYVKGYNEALSDAEKCLKQAGITVK